MRARAPHGPVRHALAIALVAGLLLVAGARAAFAEPVACGDGTCHPSETCAACPSDCGPCQPIGSVRTCLDTHAFALTFDDGPATPTASVLDTLAELGVNASFFVIGRQVAGFSDVMARMVREGHWVASHTWSHPRLTSLDDDGVRLEMKRTEDAVRDATCMRPKLMRPPYGDIDARVEAVLHDWGYLPVLWNVDSNDWRGADDILDDIHAGVARNNPNPIIHLQHDTLAASMAVVADVIHAVRGYGYHFVTIDECVYGNRGSPSREWQLSACNSTHRTACGDGTCAADESCESCEADCGVCGEDGSVDIGNTGGESDSSDTGSSSGSDTGTASPSSDGQRCGFNHPDGAECAEGLCCSVFGWCGSSEAHCAPPPPGGVCGDGKCSETESCVSCPTDCECGTCGDGMCRDEEGETCSSCTFDCGPCNPVPGLAECGDAICSGDETCTSCPRDCGPCHMPAAASECVNAGDWALTFDDGPSHVTTQLLDILADKGVQASFFVVGAAARTPGMGAVISRAAAEGHWIGNHGDDQVAWDTMTDAGLKAALEAADASIRSVACFRPRLVRPPFGRITSSQQGLLSTLGYKVVNWNLDTIDYGVDATAQGILARVAHHIVTDGAPGVGRGSVIHLQHDLLQVSVETVATIIDLVRSAGYSLVTLDECLYGRGPSSLRDFQVQDCPVVCGDGRCDATEDCTCPDCDCTAPDDGSDSGAAQPATCGNDVCDDNESCSNCCQDCGSCADVGDEVPPPVTVDGRCGLGSAVGAVCGDGQCCSQYGWCGTSDDHCGATRQHADLCPPLGIVEPLPAPSMAVVVECTDCAADSAGTCLAVESGTCVAGSGDGSSGATCPQSTVSCGTLLPTDAASVVSGTAAGALVVTLDVAAKDGRNTTRTSWLTSVLQHEGDTGFSSLALRVVLAAAVGATSADDVAVVALRDMGPGERRREGDRFGRAHMSSSSVRVQVAVAVPDAATLVAASGPGGLAHKLSAVVGTREFAALLSAGLGSQVNVAQASHMHVVAVDAADEPHANAASNPGSGFDILGQTDVAVEWLVLVGLVLCVLMACAFFTCRSRPVCCSKKRQRLRLSRLHVSSSSSVNSSPASSLYDDEGLLRVKPMRAKLSGRSMPPSFGSLASSVPAGSPRSFASGQWSPRSPRAPGQQPVRVASPRPAPALKKASSRRSPGASGKQVRFVGVQRSKSVSAHELREMRRRRRNGTEVPQLQAGDTGPAPPGVVNSVHLEDEGSAGGVEHVRPQRVAHVRVGNRSSRRRAKARARPRSPEEVGASDSTSISAGSDTSSDTASVQRAASMFGRSSGLRQATASARVATSHGSRSRVLDHEVDAALEEWWSSLPFVPETDGHD